MKIDKKILYIFLLFAVSIFANEKITLQLKWLHQFQFAGYYAAKEKGFYEEVGLDVSIKERDLAANYITKVANSEAVYGIADSILLLYKARGYPVVLVSPVFQHSPSVLIALKSSNIDSPYKLNNKKILFYENDTDGFSILALLKKLGVKPILLRKRERGDYQKLIDGRVSAMPAYTSNEPFLFKEKGIPLNIINPSHYGFDLYGDMIFTSQKEAKAHPKRVEKFKQASLKGWRYALEHKKEIAKLIRQKYSKRKSLANLLAEADAIEKIISKESQPLGALDKGRLKYINTLFQDYLEEEVEEINFKNFVFENGDNFYNLSKEELEYLRENPTIKVQNLDFLPPYNFHENGKARGFLIDYLDYLGSLINIEFEYVKTSSWVGYEDMVNKGVIDIIPNIAITKERKKDILFSDFNYISFTPAITTKKGEIFSNTLEDLDGKIGAVLHDSFLHGYVEKYYPNISLLAVPSSQRAVEMVQEGKADFAMENLSTLEYIVQKNWYLNLETTKLISKHIPLKVDLYMGYAKENRVLKSIIEKVNAKISPAKIDEIRRKWSKIELEKESMKFNEAEKSYLEKLKNIRVCIAPEWMPFERIEDSKIVGMSADYVEYFQEKLALPFSLVPTVSWTQTLELLKKRECDVVPILYSKNEEDYLSQTKSYISSPLVLATRLEEPFVSDIPSTFAKKIAYVKDYTYIDMLKRRYSKIQFIEVSSMKEGLELAKNGEVFGVVGSLASMGYYIQQDYFGDLKVSGQFNEVLDFSVGVRSDAPLLLSIMNKTVESIPKQKQKQIYETWVSVKYQESIDYEKVLIVSGVFFFIILVILYNNRAIQLINGKMSKYIKIIDDNVLTTSTDVRGNITYVSKAFLKMSQYTKEELIGKNHNVVRHKDMDKKVFEDLWKTIKQGKEWRGEIKNRKKDGAYFWTNTVITPEFNSKNEIIAFTAVREDITDKKKIEEISITDGLTNIYNRRHFNEIFPKYITNAKRNNEIVAFCIIDIDHFKFYNDNYGHQSGDEVLIRVANFFHHKTKRVDDFCFRLGGEEFGLLFKANQKEKAQQFAKEIVEGIESLQIEHKWNGPSEHITISMGLFCDYANNIEDLDSLYKETDELLYEAKKRGRNRVVYNT